MYLLQITHGPLSTSDKGSQLSKVYHLGIMSVQAFFTPYSSTRPGANQPILQIVLRRRRPSADTLSKIVSSSNLHAKDCTISVCGGWVAFCLYYLKGSRHEILIFSRLSFIHFSTDQPDLHELLINGIDNTSKLNLTLNESDYISYISINISF